MGLNVYTAISVQASYKLYYTPSGLLTCDSVICIPLADIVTKTTKLSGDSYDILPVVEILTPTNDLKLKIITNEGISVEPFSTRDLNEQINPYRNPRIYFTLPRGTTGIKAVIDAHTNAACSTNLVFGIMPPPYNYDIALIGISLPTILYAFEKSYQLNTAFNKLDGRVDALDSKTDNLKLVADMQTHSIIDIPKGAGKKTVQVQKGKLYFDTDFNYSSSPSVWHRPKITLSDDASTLTYTLELNKSVGVTIDLLSGVITAYVSNTGEIVKQIKIFNTVAGYNSIAFEDFDDISDNSLTVLATGRRVE